jgi:hypothetical protein
VIECISGGRHNTRVLSTVTPGRRIAIFQAPWGFKNAALLSSSTKRKLLFLKKKIAFLKNKRKKKILLFKKNTFLKEKNAF